MSYGYFLMKKARIWSKSTDFFGDFITFFWNFI